MLSKTPAVPKPNLQECNKTPSADSDGQSETKPQDAEAVISEADNATEENVVDQTTEEVAQTVLPEANAAAEDARGDTRNGLVRRREQQTVVRTAQKPADDRLFTLAAVGLTIAIMVLLLKKFVRSSGHGAVFMDES